ncbi:hydroxyacid dehydrogenase [Albimonas sp. CAU 1670]|uniref:NAD(P)-dependent oxidoreductase n=1 Tax=Albimonas sp. CAU 1670 TaxID=3032599 RepID=UPI0023D980B2|nr:hydroxyacid dehydrogenase [Albimonas sp. CAU 1670]MDF2233365.1 hydroxyacid dehydrogenase [Albimonas sp. CAU 1670]
MPQDRTPPAAAPVRVAMIGAPAHPAFLEAMAGAEGCELVRIPADAPVETALDALAGCDAYYITSARNELPAALHVGEALLDRAPRLRLVASYGAGFDTVDVAACTRRGVAACNQAGGNAGAVAEHALAFLLSLFKRLPEARAAIDRGEAGDRDRWMGRELSGRTVGLVGLGHTGGRLARLLAAFDCPVLACDPFLDAQTCRERGAEKVELPELLARSEAVSLHCPLDASTRGLIGAEALAAMRPGAVLVSTARGGVHDEAAVLAALASGRLAGAAFDVWDREPPAPDHPLLAHPAVIATSHLAGVTHESRERVARMAAALFADFAAGRPLPRLLNPGALR